MAVERLKELREKIREIDLQILRLLRKRFDIVHQISKMKIELGLPLIDKERECEVYSYWLQEGAKLGLPTQLVGQVVSIVLEYSKLMQVLDRFEHKWRERIRVCIIGSGKMGTMLYRILNTCNIDVVQIPARKLPQHLDKLKDRDLYILTARPEFFHSPEFDMFLKHAQKGSIMMDILSVKSHIFKLIEEKACSNNVSYISIHPLFGPLELIVGENVILIPSKCCTEDQCKLVTEFLQDLGLNVLKVESPDEHDRITSIIQVAHHIHYLSMLKFYSNFQEVVEKYVTHSLRTTLQKLSRFRELLDTLLEIQVYNKYAVEIRDLIKKCFIELVDCLNSAKTIEDAYKCVISD